MMVGITSTAFSASIVSSALLRRRRSRMRSASDRIHGIVTRWKNRPRRAKKNPKLSDRIAPKESFMPIASYRRSAFSPALNSVVSSASRQPVSGAAGPQRLGLRGVRRPAVQEQHLEGRLHPADGRRESFAVDFCRAQQRGAPAEAASALGHQVALTHGAQVAHQRERALDIRRRSSRCRPPAGRSRRAAAGRPHRAGRRRARRAG